MASSSEIQVIINASDRTSRAINSASKSVNRFSDKLRQNQQAFRNMALAGTAALGGLTFGISKAVKEASRIKEIDRLFDATFDETEKEMADWASEVADKFGRAEQDIRQMAGTAGSVLAPAFDIAEEKIAEMTQGMGEAAIALAATDPRIADAQQAMEGFTQALVGNRQRVIDWGFQVRDAQLEAEGLKRGIIETGESLDFQQKAMLTAQLITEQVSVSTKVLNDSQQDWSQIQKRLTGQIKEFAGALGQQFLPIVEKLGQRLVPIIEKTARWIEENPELTKRIIIATAAIAGLVTVVGALGFILPSIITGFALLFSPVTLVIGAITALVTAFVLFKDKILETSPELQELWNTLKELTPVFKTLGRVAIEVGGAISKILVPVLKFLISNFITTFQWSVKIATFLTNNFVSAFNIMSDAVGGFIDKLSSAIEKLTNFIQKAKEAARQSFSGIGSTIGGFASSVAGGVRNVIGVNDAVITPQGDVVKTHPDDFLIATKNPMGTTINVNINNPVMTDENMVEAMSDQVARLLRQDLRV